MNHNKYTTNNKRGAALLVVLLVVMAVTVLSLGFLSRSDVELICGENTLMRAQMDYTAESGLEYSKAMIFSPQDAGGEYWSGATGVQLESGGSDYFNVDVNKPYECLYEIDCLAYRVKSGQNIGLNRLYAELRLDPCIALWLGSSATISPETVINGDVYCGGGNLVVQGFVGGDIFSAGSAGGGTVTGGINESFGTAPVGWPGLLYSDFSSSYYYDGGGPYSVGGLSSSYNGSFPGPGMNNPSCVYYRAGDLALDGTIVINGTLVVSGKLTFDRNTIVTIVPVKNFPALVVGGDMEFVDRSASLSVTGLVQVGNWIDMKNKSGGVLEVYGGLYVGGGGIVNTSGCSVNIYTLPDKAAIETWDSSGGRYRWSPVGGAFYKRIERR